MAAGAAGARDVEHTFTRPQAEQPQPQLEAANDNALQHTLFDWQASSVIPSQTAQVNACHEDSPVDIK